MQPVRGNHDASAYAAFNAWLAGKDIPKPKKQAWVAGLPPMLADFLAGLPLSIQVSGQGRREGSDGWAHQASSCNSTEARWACYRLRCCCPLLPPALLLPMHARPPCPSHPTHPYPSPHNSCPRMAWPWCMRARCLGCRWSSSARRT